MKAREAGYKIARGEYTLFVDGYYWLKIDDCEKLYLKANDIKCDIVYYKFIFKNLDGSEDYSHKYGDYINFNKIDEYEFLRNSMISKIHPEI